MDRTKELDKLKIKNEIGDIVDYVNEMFKSAIDI